MELREYLSLYWKQRWMIAAIVLVATVIAWITASLQPVRYGVSESYAINRINRQTTSEYQYDGYYALQAADLFAQTVVSWFSTPSVIREVYATAGLESGTLEENPLSARFRVKKYSAQNIVVRFTEDTESRATKVAAAIRQLLQEKADALNRTADNKALFEIVGTTPVIAPVKTSPWLVAALAFVVSGAAALLIAVLRSYLRKA